jgi:DNA-directed RNA polymerase subunit RPC12/RpoP
MSQTLIKCRNCDNEWPKEIQKQNHGVCPVCGKSYCAKWRKWVYVGDNDKVIEIPSVNEPSDVSERLEENHGQNG